ncbi:MAG: hypothetical protein P4L99_23125 [Chthoniobacter sp.]|nr:hypothetical protein [Chthoniobacter sp.]
MHRILLTLVALCIGTAGGVAADEAVVRFPSPDRKFAIRASPPAGSDTDWKVEVIERKTGQAVGDLGTTYPAHVDDIVAVWSANSKAIGFATRGQKEGSASAYFWNGSVFEEAPFPDNLPDPDIKFGKGGGGDVKNYGGFVTPLRWLKSGELELSSDQMMMSRVDYKTYTGVVIFTLAFDAQHHATVHKVGKSKTTVD